MKDKNQKIPLRPIELETIYENFLNQKFNPLFVPSHQSRSSSTSRIKNSFNNMKDSDMQVNLRIINDYKQRTPREFPSKLTKKLNLSNRVIKIKQKSKTQEEKNQKFFELFHKLVTKKNVDINKIFFPVKSLFIRRRGRDLNANKYNDSISLSDFYPIKGDIFSRTLKYNSPLMHAFKHCIKTGEYIPLKGEKTEEQLKEENELFMRRHFPMSFKTLSEFKKNNKENSEKEGKIIYEYRSNLPPTEEEKKSKLKDFKFRYWLQHGIRNFSMPKLSYNIEHSSLNNNSKYKYKYD